MQEIKIEGLDQIDRLVKKLEQSPQIMAQAKRRAFEEAAPEEKRIVDRHIGGSGKVRSWQASQVGSKGGYAAVRPKKDTWTEATKKNGKRYAVGAVTNAIVSGHAFPSPSGRKYYKSRIESGTMKVAPKPFYSASKPEIKELATKTAEKVVQDLFSHLEG